MLQADNTEYMVARWFFEETPSDILYRYVREWELVVRRDLMDSKQRQWLRAAQDILRERELKARILTFVRQWRMPKRQPAS